MKLKAVLSEGCSQEMRAALENNDFRLRVLAAVIEKHLHAKDFGPAEFYIQKCDTAVGAELMCEVRLSGVSVNRTRSTQDFENARWALEQLYKEFIVAFLKPGKQLQLMVSLMLDRVPLDSNSTLVEGEAIWLKGAPREN